ncbi:MAG TPA: HAD-IIB family hydrolase [Polyangiaceae bacterium]|nr:HAD-IIB family hydrolase [Polyangiaceae bacterium]
MKPLSALSQVEARALRGVLFDLDDTLLDHGKLTEAAYAALFRLRESGLELYAVTGRPLTWVRLIARLFPVDGGVGENGGVLVAAGGRVLEVLAPAERAARSARLRTLVAEVRARFTELEPADDATERLSDFTFDVGEHRRVARERVAEVTAFAQARGATVHVSSVHLHVGFDAVDKASGVVRLLRTLHGTDPSAALTRYAFVGDSENDAACFGAFSVTVGVANLRGRPTLAPRYLTQAPRGQGFAELARVLGALRASAE